MSSIIIGHSHAIALSNGAKNVASNFSSLIGTGYPKLNWKFESSRGTLFRNIFLKRYTENEFTLLSKLDLPKNIFVCWNGNQHQIRGLLANKVDFDFYTPNSKNFQNKYLIPSSIVDDFLDWGFIQGGISNWLKKLIELKNIKSPNSRIILLGSPPPLPQSESRARILKERFFYDSGLVKENHEILLLDEIVRLKFWKKWIERLEFWATELSIQYIGHPKTIFDEKGFLAHFFWGNDLTHANDRYGLEYFQHIQKELNEPSL